MSFYHVTAIEIDQILCDEGNQKCYDFRPGNSCVIDFSIFGHYRYLTTFSPSNKKVCYGIPFEWK